MTSIFAAWRVPGSAREIRELYRKRFAIKSSYRQLGQARIHTSTRSPVERVLLALTVIALVLRILWAWMLWKYFADGTPDDPVLDVDRL
jgi:IS4 transposase